MCVLITESPDGEIQSDRGVQKLQPCAMGAGNCGFRRPDPPRVTVVVFHQDFEEDTFSMKKLDKDAVNAFFRWHGMIHGDDRPATAPT